LTTTPITEAVVCHAGTAQATPAELLQLRRTLPALFLGKPLPGSLLKHADEQALLGLSAVHAACRGAAFPDWGLVACPRRPGRTTMQPALARFAAEGAWSVSPHIVPHCSLHSLSGLLSMALDLHGPNLGAGGVPGSEGEAVLAALTLLEGDELPGIWLVFTGWQPDSTQPNAVCRAVALGLTRSGQTGIGRLRWSSSACQETAFEMESLFDLLESARTHRSWSLGSNGRLEFITEEPR
jgi:hypothetical protein